MRTHIRDSFETDSTLKAMAQFLPLVTEPDSTVNVEVFKNDILLFPAVSCGNIGQIACDLLLYNLRDEVQRVGYLRSRNITPVVGNDAILLPGENPGQLSTAIEVYRIASQGLTIIQQRSPMLKVCH